MSLKKYLNLASSKSILLKILLVILMGGVAAGCASQTSYQPQSQSQPVMPEPAPEPAVPQLASISNIDFEEKTDSVRVIIKGSEPLTYNVTQMEFPVRLAIDVARARLEAPAETITVNKGGVSEIWPSELEISGETTTRIEIGLDTYSANYEILPSGNDLFIDFFTFPEVLPVKMANNIVAVVINDAKDFVQVDIVADGKIENYNFFDLSEPSRLVLDFPGIDVLLPDKEKEASSPLLRKIRCGKHPDYVRMVLDSPLPDMPPFQVVSTSNGVTIFLGSGFEKKKEELVVLASSPPVATEGESASSADEVAPLASESEESLPAASSESSLEKISETASEASPEASPEPEPLPEPVVSPKETSEPSYEIAEEAGEEQPVAEESTEIAEEAGEEQPAVEESAEMAEESRSLDLAVVEEEEEEGPLYTGEHISLDFKDADISNILRLIAEVSNLNIVAGDDVEGTVTIRLTDVPWDQALEVILLSNNLGKTLEGNILRVAPIERLNRERQAAVTARESAEKLEPLKKGLISVSYANVDEMKEIIFNTNIISSRGSIETDVRTNTMIVIDIEKNIREVRRIIDQLDTPTPQVLIESKIVQINPTYTKELGITWEGGYTTALDDGLIGIGGNQMVGIDLGSGTVTTKGTIVDLAPAAGVGSGGAISFGFLNPNFGIFQKIAALEKDEKLQIISSPRIMTLDNKEAKIEQGVDLPYLKLSEEGVTSTEFKKATLLLRVTPHVTADKSIMMDIEVKKDQKSAQTGAGGEPGIDTRNAETQVLVRNGDTVVIGGIYEETTQNIHNSVPFFGRLPILSFFFKNTRDHKETTELIIFITPTIITIEKSPVVAVTSDN